MNVLMIVKDKWAPEISANVLYQGQPRLSTRRTLTITNDRVMLCTQA